MITPQNAGAMNTLFAPTRFVNQSVIATKSGELIVFFRLRGIDSDWQTDAMLEDQHGSLATAFRAIPEGFRMHQYLLKMEGAQIPEPLDYGNETVNETVARRNSFLVSNPETPLSTITHYLCLIYEPKTLERWLKVGRKYRTLVAAKLAEDTERLLGVAKTFAHNTRDLLGTVLMNKEEAFTFLRFLACYDRDIAAKEPLVYDNNVDYWIGSEAIECHPKHIAIGSRNLEVFSLRRLPRATWPALLRDLLKIKDNFLVATDYVKQPAQAATKAIAKAQDHFQQTQWMRDPKSLLRLAMSRGKKENLVPDESAKATIAELGQTLVSIGQGETMGHFSLTAVFWTADGTKPTVPVTEAEKLFGSHEGSLTRETYWALGALLSLIPGSIPQYNFRQRSHWLSLSQYIDLGLFCSHDPGHLINAHLNQEYLLALRTTDDTLHYFNLHHGDLMGALLFGVPGSGKSVLANLCVDHSLKYNPETLILDGLGGSYRTLTRKHNGNYFELDPDGAWPFTLNPCALPDSRKTRQHLAMLVRTCLATGGYKLNARRNQIIYQAVQKLFTLPVEQRRFSALELPSDIAVYFAPWIEGGQYDFVFDNVRDRFALSHLQTIDFSAMDGYPDVLQPLLFHFFYLWGTVVNDPERTTNLKLMVVDEGWKMISYPAARRYIQTAGRTWRKRNGGILLATQSATELRDANMLAIINELCPTKLLLANPDADFAEYARIFHLNEREVANYRSLRGKGDLLWKAGGRSKVLKVDLDPESLWTYASSPFENARRDAAIAQYGFDKALKVLAAQTA